MLTGIDVKFIFNSARLGLSSSTNTLQIWNSRCSPPGCLVAVFAIFLVIISPSSSGSSYSWNELNVRRFFFTTKTTQPRPQVFSETLP